MSKKIDSLLFVCLGNICRSPALHAEMEHILHENGLSKAVHVDSCALRFSFIGSPADSRMQAVAKSHGVEIHTTAKPLQSAYFDQFDFIFGVTQDIVDELKMLANDFGSKTNVHLATEYSEKYPKQDIRDPYSCGEKGFEVVWDQITDSCLGIYQHLFKE